jgi:ADP-ribose pyrophosphatase YjhB (NUDIX family)
MSRTGAPEWLASTVNYCSRCGASLSFGPILGEERERFACAECGFVAYINPRIVVATLPITDAGEVVLIRRAIEPAIGSWALPGGFLEIDETVREGAVRETMEETGLLVEPREIVGVYSLPRAAVVVIAFDASIAGGAPRPSPEALEVRAFSLRNIPWPEIRLEASAAALRDWTRRADQVAWTGAAPETGSVSS